MNHKQRIGWKARILLFLTSQCITLFGSTLVQMALVWYAAMQTSSGGWVAAFSVCAYLPQFLLSFFGGVWADRYPRKKLIMGADVLIAAATLLMVLQCSIVYQNRCYWPAYLLCRPFVLWAPVCKIRQFRQ